MDSKDIMEVCSLKQFDEILTSSSKCLTVMHFTAKWSSHCQQVREVLKELKRQSAEKNILIVEVEAEECPSLSQRFNVVAVPTCILFKNGAEISRIEGVNAQELCTQIQSYMDEEENRDSHLKSLVNRSPVMVFMKGDPTQPRCGFSKTLVNLLNEEGIKFGSFDILSNEEVRQGLKKFSNWPTYPQVYIKGELVGGLDIVKELIEAGEFSTMLPKEDGLEDKLKKLINQEKIMLFMKGSPDAAKCGFSKSIVEILNSKSIKYGHFDILTNNEIRQGLKLYSNWPTYPQLYIKGELVGGLDIVKEMENSGELDNMLTE